MAARVTAGGLVSNKCSDEQPKIREGGPNDDPADLSSDVWAGVLPMRLVTDAPVAAANLLPGIGVPESVRRAARR